MLEELIILFVINFIGIIISKVFALPVPGTILGMILFFILLQTKVLKPEKVENAVSVLLINMTILFLPPAVNIMDNLEFLNGQFIKVLILIVITTLITMGTTGKIVQIMIELNEKNSKEGK